MGTTTTFPCPLCGKDRNRRGDPFTDPGRTVAHINGSHDDVHRNESGDDHMSAIENNETEVEEQDGANESDTVQDAAGKMATDGKGQNGSEPMIESDMVDEDVPLSDAVQDHERMLENPEEFGLGTVTEAQLMDVLEELEEVKARVNSLEKVSCPSCGTPTEHPNDLTDGSQYRCTECGNHFRYRDDGPVSS